MQAQAHTTNGSEHAGRAPSEGGYRERGNRRGARMGAHSTQFAAHALW